MGKLIQTSNKNSKLTQTHCLLSVKIIHRLFSFLIYTYALYLFLLYVLYICMSESWVSCSEMDIWSPRPRGTDCCELLCEYWNKNSSLLGKHSVLELNPLSSPSLCLNINISHFLECLFMCLPIFVHWLCFLGIFYWKSN